MPYGSLQHCTSAASSTQPCVCAHVSPRVLISAALLLQCHMDQPSRASNLAHMQFQKPWLTRMTERQVLVMMALEVLPLTLLLYPAGVNALSAALGLYNKLLAGLGLAISPEQSLGVALVLVALIGGLGKSVELSVRCCRQGACLRISASWYMVQVLVFAFALASSHCNQQRS